MRNKDFGVELDPGGEKYFCLLAACQSKKILIESFIQLMSNLNTCIS